MREVSNDDSKVWTVTEKKTIEVKFYPSPHSSLQLTKCLDGTVNASLSVAKAFGIYEDHSVVSREDLLKLANSLLELAK